MDKIEEFLKGKPTRAWLFFPGLKVYVRKGHHLINKEIVDTFDIAAVEVPEKLQQKGIFTEFLTMCEEKIDLPIYVENVINPHLYTFMLLRDGYALIGDNCFVSSKDNSFFKK